MFCLHRLRKLILMVCTPCHTWLQNYGTLFQILSELLTFLNSSARFYSIPLFSSLEFQNAIISQFQQYLELSIDLTRIYKLIFSYFNFEIKKGTWYMCVLCSSNMSLLIRFSRLHVSQTDLIAKTTLSVTLGIERIDQTTFTPSFFWSIQQNARGS